VKELGERFTERLQQLKAASRPSTKDSDETAGLALPPSASKELRVLIE
jgi:hypothetical protein